LRRSLNVPTKEFEAELRRMELLAPRNLRERLAQRALLGALGTP
jgi:hypothetical protein